MRYYALDDLLQHPRDLNNVTMLIDNDIIYFYDRDDKLILSMDPVEFIEQAADKLKIYWEHV